MKKLELHQMEIYQGGKACTQEEMVSYGATMLVLGVLSFGFLAVGYGALMAGGCIIKELQ